MKRICRKCHRTTSRDVCVDCRRLVNVSVHRELKAINTQSVWTAVLRRQLFKS